MWDEPEKFRDLPRSEMALLWAMRVWVVGHCRQQEVSARIVAGWHDLGVTDAISFLEGFMWALSRAARRPIDVLCLCREDVSADERLLLDTFALMQRDEPADAHAGLCQLMSEPAAAIALRSADGIVQRFTDAGVVLPWTSASGGQADTRMSPRLLH